MAASIVAKKWEPGNLVPSRFSGEIRKVEARLGKLRQIRKVHPKDFRKFGVRPKKRKKGPHLILVGKLGKLSQIRKVHLED